MVKLVVVPLLRSLPKNCSVGSKMLSFRIGTRTTVESDQGGKLTGTAFAVVIPVKSFSAVAEEETREERRCSDINLVPNVR